MYRERLQVPSENEFVRRSSRNESRKGQDTDIYEYDEINPEGELVARYVIRDSMSIYPPQTTTTLFSKYDLEGVQVDSGIIY